MILGVPLAGDGNVKEWLPLLTALADRKIKVAKKVPRKDWRSRVAARDGGWLAWFNVDEDDHGSAVITVGVGLIAHDPKDEKTIRRDGFVSVRPFTRPRTQVPVSCILGTMEIEDGDRHIWAQADGRPGSVAASQLRHSPWWCIRADPETSKPTAVFMPSRADLGPVKVVSTTEAGL